MTVIRGRVVDEAGAPVEHASIYVVSSPQPMPDIAQLSAADGTFALAARAPGEYVIGARADAAGTGRSRVRVGEGDEVRIEIRLAR